MLSRIFISIPVADQVRDALSRLADAVRDEAPTLRWVRPDQYHITLKFLGEIPAHRVADVVEAVQATARQYEPLRLRARGIGAFPDVRRARVVWAGISADAGAQVEGGAPARQPLSAVHTTLDGELATRGFPREGRSFTAHLTIARTRHVEALPKVLRPYAAHDFGGWEAERMEIVESELSPSGPHHRALHSIPFTRGL